MGKSKASAGVSFGLLLLSGCGTGFVHDEQLTGPYRLVAADEMEQMHLCRSLPEGNCIGDGLPEQTVFAAGADAQFVVIKRHPRAWPNPADRTRTEYFYVIRSDDEANGVPMENIQGPFNAAQFAAEKRRIKLPAFSREFEELR